MMIKMDAQKGAGGGGSYQPIGSYSNSYGSNSDVKSYAYDVSNCNSITVTYQLDNSYYANVFTYFVGTGKTESDSYFSALTPSTSQQSVTIDVSDIDVLWMFLQITNSGARTLSGTITKVS